MLDMAYSLSVVGARGGGRRHDGDGQCRIDGVCRGGGWGDGGFAIEKIAGCEDSVSAGVRFDACFLTKTVLVFCKLANGNLKFKTSCTAVRSSQVTHVIGAGCCLRAAAATSSRANP